jgi:hypothetical protein
MMAYVDEFGNISSTPPDSKKQNAVIKTEDIGIVALEQLPVNSADLIRKGTVTFFNEVKGYGFIKDR